jgi:hypothetical protein
MSSSLVQSINAAISSQVSRVYGNLNLPQSTSNATSNLNGSISQNITHGIQNQVRQSIGGFNLSNGGGFSSSSGTLIGTITGSIQRQVNRILGPINRGFTEPNRELTLDELVDLAPFALSFSPFLSVYQGMNWINLILDRLLEFLSGGGQQNTP